MSKPDLGDTVINRYTLVSRLRDAPGLQAWKASDRVLARDCQLFIVSDEDSLPQVNAIASSLALSRNGRFTRVLQLQHRSSVAIIITSLDAGVSLTNYLAGSAGHTLSYEAVRTIIGECARAEQQLLIDGISHRSLSTDTIRVTSQGIQLADAPISPLLDELSRASREFSAEQLATRQLSGVLYAMLTHSTSRNIAEFDLDRLGIDVPGEFRLICARGLELQDRTRQNATVPMVSLSELTALLGSWTPVTKLHHTDIALPGIDGENSVITAPITTNPHHRLLPIPEDMSSNSPARTLPTSVIFPLPTVPSAADAPGLSMAGAEPAPTGFPADAAVRHDTASSVPEASGAWRSLLDKGRSIVTSRTGAAPQHDSNVASLSTPEPNPDFHEVAAQEMENIISTPDTTTIDSVFPAFVHDQNRRHGHEAPRFDFTTRVGTAGSRTTHADQHRHVRTESTGSIPVFGEGGALIRPGEESRRALQAERRSKETAGNAGLPPSFIPRSQQTGAEAIDDDVANAPLFSRFTTKVVSITMIAIIVAVALAFALRAMTGGTTGSDSGITNNSGVWPEMNLNDVPFGASSSSGKSSSSSSSSSTATSTSSPSATATISTADHSVSSVPTPSIPENSTPFDIDKQEFLTNPGGQSGFGYYMHLSQEQTAQRFVVTIRSSGGMGYLLANTSDDPSAGTQVAKFTFDSSGTTDIKFTKPVKAQDFLLWVPLDSLPNNQLYINSVKIY